MNWAKAILSDTRKGLRPIALVSIMLNLLLLTSPLYMLQVYDRVLMSGQLSTLFWVSIMALVAFAGLGVFDALRARSLAQLGSWVGLRASGHVMNAALKESAHGGEKSGRHLRDLQQIQRFVGGNGITPLFDLPFTPLFVVVTFMLHPMIGLLTVVGGIILFTIAFLTERRARKAAQDIRTADIQATRVADTFLQGADYLESAGMRSMATDRFLRASIEHQDINLSDQTAHSRATSLSKALRMTLQSASLGLGAVFVLAGQMTPGGMIAGSILMSRALSPIDNAIGAWQGFQSARDAYRSLLELSVRSSADQDNIVLPEPEGRVKAKGVLYAYSGASDPLFANVNFEAGPGELVGLVGSSGTGKTRLCRLLTGIDAPTRGTIELDGASLQQWNKDQLGQAIGYLPQLPVFFDGTVAQNIARFSSDATDEQIVAAAKATGAHELIIQLPDGYATMIGPLGIRLSGGQSQLIGLARATFSDPKILILDEPTAHLDEASRASFGAWLSQTLVSRKTVIVATHDVALVRTCHRIILLKGGTAQVQEPKKTTRATAEATGTDDRNLKVVPRIAPKV